MLIFCVYWYDKSKAVSLVFGGLLLVAMLYIGSRSSIVGVAVGFTAISKRKYIPLAIIGIVVAFNWQRLTDSESLAQRLEQWRCCLVMIKGNPLGVGAGNFLIDFQKYAHGINYVSTGDSLMFRFPHNDYLWICSEVGIVGLVSYLAVIGSGLRNAITAKSKYLVFGLSGYMGIAFFCSVNERPFATLMLATMVGLSCKK
jgi:O-antigen ligase